MDRINRAHGCGAVHCAGESLGAVTDAATAEVGGQHDGVGGAASGRMNSVEPVFVTHRQSVQAGLEIAPVGKMAVHQGDEAGAVGPL